MPTVRFHPEAVAEARAAWQWYSDRNSSAADAFLAELEEALESIVEAPARVTPQPGTLPPGTNPPGTQPGGQNNQNNQGNATNPPGAQGNLPNPPQAGSPARLTRDAGLSPSTAGVPAR